MPHLPASQRSRLSQSITHALFVSLLAASPLLVASTAQAQSASAEQSRSYAIPAGNLDQALNRFASEAGILLSVDSRLTTGKQSPGLNGSYSVDAGLAQLLAGTGLRPLKAGDNYALEALADSSEALELGATSITGTGLQTSATENTGSYVSTSPITTATPLGLTLRETPQSVSVITKQRMEDQGLNTIQQTLAQVPGVKTSSLGTELGGASARGYSITNYQFDGVNTFVQVLGGGAVPSSTLADMAIYDRVEVLRGASGLVSGVGDPSGTINMVRKKPTTEFQGSVDLSAGSWDEKRGVLDLSGPLNEARTIRGRMVALSQDGDSYIDNYERKKNQIYGVLEADLTSTTLLTAGVEHERSEIKGQSAYTGFPLWYSDGTRTDLSRSFSSASRDNWLDLESTKVFTTLEQQLGDDWRLKLSASQGRSSHEEERTVFDIDAAFSNQAGDGTPLWASKRNGHIEQSNVDLNLLGSFTLLGRQHELVVGAAKEDYEQVIKSHSDTSGLTGTAANLFTWDRRGEGVYGPVRVNSRYDMKQSSLYGATRFQVTDKLKLIAGTRVLWHDYDFAESWSAGSNSTSTSEDSVFTPYVGAVYDINNIHSVYASYTTIYQPQSVRDRSGAVLDPVEGANYEIGLKSAWLDGKLNNAVALYQIRQDNLAETDSGYIVPGTTDTAAYRAVKGAKTEGMDVEFSGALSDDWNVSASWTYSQTENAKNERINTTFPRHMVKLWSTYRMPGDWNKLTVGGGVNWQSKTYSTVNAWQIDRDLYWEQKSFAIANLMARYDFNDKLSTTLNVNNVFDKKYISSVSDWWYSGNYGEPRSLHLNMKYNF